MKLHFYTKESAPYSFESFVELFEDKEFKSRICREKIEDIINSDEAREAFYNCDMSELEGAIDSLFDMSTNGVFDWTNKTDEYYDHFNRMIKCLNCKVEFDSGEIIAECDCDFSDIFHLDGQTLYITLTNFYSGNGEPKGAQLALDLVECFMKTNQWHVGLYDSKGLLVTDITSYAKNNKLDIQAITPIVWFGHKDDVQECWSITPNTRDSFIQEIWGDYFEGALEHICNASSGLGIYYSVWEYGLDYNESLFNEIKSNCPIDLNLSESARKNALYSLIVSMFNENQ